MATKSAVDAELAGAGVGPAASEFRTRLSWRDGFVLALVVPVGIFATIAPSIGAIGSWAVAALFAVACCIGVLQNYIYAEMAAMFPDKPGGITMYAHEAWRRYLSPTGAVAAFGYWAGWAFANAVFALTLGQLLQAQFFAGATWTVSTGGADIGLAHLIGIACLVSVWVLNAMGTRPTVQINKVLGALAVGLIAILVVGPFITGDFDVDNLTWGLGADGQAWGGWRLAFVFLFIFGWTGYATEVCATFAPEYKDPKRDTYRAMRAAGLFTLVLAVMMPIGLGGTLGDALIAENPGAVYVDAFTEIVGPAAGLVTILICVSLYLIMNSVTAAAGRALYGLAKAGMTVKQLDHLNAKGVPARAMFLDLLINLVILLFVGNVLSIIFTSNAGYILATVLTLSGFLLLRKDRPGWPRPIRRGRAWIPLAAVLVAYNSLLLVVGFLFPGDAGYGGTAEQLIVIGILLLSLVLFVFRRAVQDRRPLRLREPAPALPGDLEPAAPDPERAIDPVVGA